MCVKHPASLEKVEDLAAGTSVPCCGWGVAFACPSYLPASPCRDCVSPRVENLGMEFENTPILILGLPLPGLLLMLEVEFVTPVFINIFFPCNVFLFCLEHLEDLKCIMMWLEISHIVAGEILQDGGALRSHQGGDCLFYQYLGPRLRKNCYLWVRLIFPKTLRSSVVCATS